MINSKRTTGQSLKYLSGSIPQSANIQYTAQFAGTPGSDLGYFGGESASGDDAWAAANALQTSNLQNQALAAAQSGEEQRAAYCRKNRKDDSSICPENKGKDDWWKKLAGGLGGAIAGGLIGGPIGAITMGIAGSEFATL